VNTDQIRVLFFIAPAGTTPADVIYFFSISVNWLNDVGVGIQGTTVLYDNDEEIFRSYVELNDPTTNAVADSINIGWLATNDVEHNFAVLCNVSGYAGDASVRGNWIVNSKTL
jgi:hypothetical protein